MFGHPSLNPVGVVGLPLCCPG